MGGDTRAMFGVLLDPASGVTLSPAARATLERRLGEAEPSTSRTCRRSRPRTIPTTLGIGEPFTATVTVSFYFALLVSLPLLLFEVYGFVIPAFSPRERASRCP